MSSSSFTSPVTPGTRFTTAVAAASVLIYDVEPSGARTLAAMLRQSGFAGVATARSVPDFCRLAATRPPDLVLITVSGSISRRDRRERLQEALGSLLEGERSPAVVGLLADGSAETRHQALALGARDWLLKPYDPLEVRLRTENLLEIRLLRARLATEAQWVEERVRERTAELEEAHTEILERLALAAEYRDDCTGQHTHRVGQLSAVIARTLGLPGGEVSLIRRAALLHDVGKIGLPDRILLKPGRLTPTEYEQMKAHAGMGARLLSRSPFRLLQQAAEIALTHHERWDGAGYPRGLEGEAIPLPGRIVAVADVWDALTHERPYKPAWSRDQALREIRVQSGRQFDPRVAEAFLRTQSAAG